MYRWFQRRVQKAQFLVLIGIVCVRISYPGGTASAVSQSMIDQAQSALKALEGSDCESAWKIWDALAADPLCPVRKHARHMAAQARSVRIMNPDRPEQFDAEPVADEAIAILKILASDQTYPFREAAFKDLSNLLEFLQSWNLLLEHLTEKTADSGFALLRAKALFQTGAIAAAESNLRTLWLNPDSLSSAAAVDELYREVLRSRGIMEPDASVPELYQRARSLDRIGERVEATKLYQKIMESGASGDMLTDAKLFLAKILSDTFQTREALAAYDGFLKDHPGHSSTATVLFRKSILFRRTGDDAAYLNMVERVAKEFPASKRRDTMLLGRGDYRRTLREWDRAEADYQDVIRTGKIDRDHASWKYVWTAFDRGETAQAIQRLGKMKSSYGGTGWELPMKYWQIRFRHLLVESGFDTDPYRRIATEDPWDYYGQLSAGHIGLAVPAPPSQPIPDMNPEEQTSEHIPAAMFLEKLALWDRASAEWEWAARQERQMSDSMLYRRALCLYRSGDIPSARRLVIRRFEKDIPKGRISQQFAEILYPFPENLKPFYLTAARPSGLDPLLAVAVTLQESGFDRKALSHNLAGGLMQVMPDLFKRFASQWPENPDITDYQRPEYNIRAGVEYLAWLLDRYEGSLPKALAGYNAGEHRVDAWIREYPWPEEIWIEHIPFQQTRMFVKKILENYECYRVIYPVSDRIVTGDHANNLTGREKNTK